MDHDEVMELIHYVDDVNVAHGATTSYFSTTTPEAQALAKKATRIRPSSFTGTVQTSWYRK